MKSKAPPVPKAFDQTARQRLVELLRQGPHTVRELSAAAHLAEKEVRSHLEHLRRSLGRDHPRLEATPPACRGCGFVFAKRSRLKKPGRCPICRGESIEEPRFFLG